MRALEYALRQGAASLWRSRGSSAFAVLAIALALVVLGTLLLLTSNAERLLSRWTSASEFSVYLADAATSEQRGAVESAIDQSGVSAGREYVSKAQALTRFREEFAELASPGRRVRGQPVSRLDRGARRGGSRAGWPSRCPRQAGRAASRSRRRPVRPRVAGAGWLGARYRQGRRLWAGAPDGAGCGRHRRRQWSASAWSRGVTKLKSWNWSALP